MSYAKRWDYYLERAEALRLEIAQAVALLPLRILRNHGTDELWEYLEGYYRHVFHRAKYPEEKPYSLKRRA